jgi:uroporphyrinogen decarboxylase
MIEDASKKTSYRDRVLSALRGEEVYPVPFDIYLNYIYPELEGKLLVHYGLAPDDHYGLFKALDAHTRFGRPLYIGPEGKEIPNVTPAPPFTKVVIGMWGTIEGVENQSDNLYRPLINAESVAEVDAHPWPKPEWFDYSRIGWFFDQPDEYLPVKQWALKYNDYARWVQDWQPVFSRVMDLFGIETGLMNLAAKPKIMQAAIEHITDFLEQYYTNLAKSVAGQADIFGFGDDFGGQQGMLLSPKMWRNYFVPVWKRLFPIAHKYGMKSSMHACGSIRPVIRDLMDAGLDILEVTQISAAGMDPVELKHEYGSQLTFCGGVDVQYVLTTGTPEQVRQETRRLADIFGRNGRYILSSTHFLLDDVPAENAIAMHDAAMEFKRG